MMTECGHGLQVRLTLNQYFVNNQYQGGREAEYTNWHPAAVPDAPGVNCMQLLSATVYDGQWMTYECEDNYLNVHAVCQLKSVFINNS